MGRQRRHDVAAVVYDGLCTFEFGIAVEVFGLPRPELGTDWYRFTVCSADPGGLRTTAGVTVTAPHGVEALVDAGTIVVPGWRDPDEAPPEPLIAALRAAHARGARLVSICSGVFVLAAAGLLDRRPATTHWRYADALARRHPAVRVRPDVLYVDDGDILTSAGSAAGIDLCLHIVRSDFGADVASQVARRLVVSPHREGGQAQYVPRTLPRPSTRPIASVLDWAQRRLGQPLTVSDLAHVAAMAPRTFARRFREETGTSPHRWLVQQRLHEAQRQLEMTDHPIDRIARSTGFATPETLRHHFRNTFGTSPSSYRRRFRANN